MQRTTALTLVESWWPRVGLGRDVLLVVAGSLFVALCAQISIPILPVPITGQTLAVVLVGAALGSRRGALSMLAYVGEGLTGLPVLAGGNSAWSPSSAPGIPVILGPSAGYLLGFVPAAFVVGLLAERGWDRSFPRAVAAMALGTLVIYVFGLAWLARFVPTASLLAFGLIPFLPGDAAKVVIAAAALPGAWSLTRRTPPRP